MRNTDNLPMTINETSVNVTKIDGTDYISLTDMAKASGSERAIQSWLRNKNTIDFLGFWEQLNNSDFKPHEFVYFKNNAGANSFNPSMLEWIERTNAKGIISKRGRYGGTYAHKDIAFEFGTWLSPEFKLLIITEFQRLKAKEQKLIEWDSHRYLASVNYRLHTDSIKYDLLPTLDLLKSQHSFIYADEADMLNKLVFGKTMSEWKSENPDQAKNGKNQRDYASAGQLVLMANLESLNAHLMSENKTQPERITMLMKSVERHYRALIDEDVEQKKLSKG
jgi:hypothetical protein